MYDREDILSSDDYAKVYKSVEQISKFCSKRNCFECPLYNNDSYLCAFSIHTPNFWANNIPGPQNFHAL